MKLLRAVPRISHVGLISRTSSRSSRHLSIASAPSAKPLSSTSTSKLPFTSRHASTTTSLRKTPLYDLHLSHGAKIVPFGGFQMPVQYDSLSVSASHHFTRSHASLFDVSHMVQHQFSGLGATAFLQRITPISLASLKPGESKLSTLLWPFTGGIVDDTIITRLGPELFYVVTNAGCREKDLVYFKEQIAEFRKTDAAEDKEVKWEVLDGWGLVALQGPLSEEILERVAFLPEGTKLSEMSFGQSRVIGIKGLSGKLVGPLLATRGGYTGEDGFEIAIPPQHAVQVTEALLQSAGKEKLQLAGLGARDSLRLEAGMCLYGHDLDDSTTPVEASLSWVIGKDRRVEGGFHGADIILKQLVPKSKGGMGVEKRRVGMIVEGAPAREGAEIVDEKGEKIGNVTSGCPSPTLGKNIAMGYVKDGFHKAGTNVEVVVRGKRRKAEITKMPFVPNKYKKGGEAPKDLPLDNDLSMGSGMKSWEKL